MKAKYFTKLRRKVSTYLVVRSYGMFGDFPREPCYTEVIAKSAQNAAERYMKRTHCIEDLTNWDHSAEKSNEMFAKLKVMPKNQPYERFITYWR